MAYGVWTGWCDNCKWLTMNGGKEKPTKCEKCGCTEESVHHGKKSFKAELREDVACVVAHRADQQSTEIRHHAEIHGLRVVQVSKNRFLVVQDDHPATFGMQKYPEGAEPHKWAFVQMRIVTGPCDYQAAMRYVREHTKPVPEYLRK